MPPSGRRAERISSTLSEGWSLQADRLFVIEQALEPLGDEIVGAPRAVGAARGVEADDLVEADADPHHRRRQGEEVGELAVPGGEREIVVEDGDALARVVERVLQLVAARLDRRRRVVEQLQRRLARHGATAQQQRQHQTRGRGADRRRQQVLGVTDQMRVGLFGRREVEPALALERLERAPRPLGAEIARDRRLELARRRRGAPQPERLRLAARRGADESRRLHPFERRRLARQRGDDEGEHVEAERQNDAADQRIGGEAGQRGRTQPGEAERSVGEEFRQRALAVERGQQQQVEPRRQARRHAGDGAARGAAPPDEPAEKGRADLRHRGEGQQADRGERRRAGQPRVEIAERQHAENGEAAHGEHALADLARRRRVALRGAAAQQDRHDEIVGDGDRQRDAVDHHHAGRRRQAAEHGGQRQQMRAGVERQRQHGEVAVDRAVGEGQQAGDRQRHDEQVDQDEIDREQPGGAGDVGRDRGSRPR